jgi:hypothetical protein
MNEAQRFKRLSHFWFCVPQVKKLYTFRLRNPELYEELVPSRLRTPILQDVLTILPLRNQFGRRMFLVEIGKISCVLVLKKWSSALQILRAITGYRPPDCTLVSVRAVFVTDFRFLPGPITPCRPPLWPSGQSFRLQIQRSGFDSQRYQIFWEIAGLERGPLGLVSTTEELREWYV